MLYKLKYNCKINEGGYTSCLGFMKMGYPVISKVLCLYRRANERRDHLIYILSYRKHPVKKCEFKNREFIMLKSIRKFIICLIAFVLILTLLTACEKEKGEMIGIIFERGNGSSYGSQFYIDVRKDEILKVSFFPENSSQQVTYEHISISGEKWQEILKATKEIELKKNKSSLKEKIFGSSKLDGGDYRKLSLIYENNEEIKYKWPQSEKAQKLEDLLTSLYENGEKI